jgi:NADH dehydrogenase/NADH:ubiquinone oxidoreductase subunit G
MVKILIDGKEVEAEKGSMLIEAARGAGAVIPSLCYNDELPSYGACRLCLVEVKKGKRSRVTTSCNYPVMEGIEVFTATEKILKYRRVNMELILARCPKSEAIQEMAKEMGIEKPRFSLKDEDCILCGQCVRACKDVVGVSAINFVNRGDKRWVATPFFDHSAVCIGCGSCAYVCPTQCIGMEDTGDVRSFRKWNTEFKLKSCKACGCHFAPEFQLEYMRKKANLPKDHFDTCPTCRP